MFSLLNRLLENVVTRTLLSVAIVISLVPHEWMHANDAWFLALFGPEFAIRTLLAFREESVDRPVYVRPKEGWRKPKRGEVALLVFDLLALASFLPAGTIVESARWLRLFRLSRTLLLLRYWAPLVRDLWSVVSRRERRRQLALVFGSLLALTFGGAVILDHLTDAVGDDFDGDGVVGDAHDHDFLVRMWWAFRQLEDPGNLLASPHDTGTLVVSVGLTLAGLFVVSFIIGVGTDIVMELTAVSRTRPPGVRRHTVLVNLNAGTSQLLAELLGEERKLLPGARSLSYVWFKQLLRNVRRGRDFVVVGSDEERPAFLQDPNFARVVYRTWNDDDDDTLLVRADVAAARRVVLLNDAEAGTGDAPIIRTLVTVVERLRETGPQDGVQRKLVVEVVEEDNVATAWRAASRAPLYLTPTVVPTERLLARFLACVGRRQGVAGVLTELLRSEGRELYTFDYGYVDRDRTLPERPPPLGSDALAAMSRIAGHADAAGPERRIVPIGLLTRTADGASVLINPGANARIEGELSGFLAIAPHFDLVSEFAAGLAEAGSPSPDVSASGMPELVQQPTIVPRKVCVCGFRSAGVSLLESLLVAEPDAQILVLVSDELSRQRALSELEAHSKMVGRGLMPGRHGRFVSREADGALVWVPQSGESGQGAIFIELADWTVTERLADLPREFGGVPDVDLLVFVSDEAAHEDARTTTALMKVEDLCIRMGRETLPRVVAEVDDPELALRLTRRYAAMNRGEVHVFSVQELRSLLMFQSIVVPHFSAIYEELMSPWGQSLVALQSQGGGRVPYTQLARALRAEGRILVAVDRRHRGEREVVLGRGHDGDEVDLENARLWVIQPD